MRRRSRYSSSRYTPPPPPRAPFASTVPLSPLWHVEEHDVPNLTRRVWTGSIDELADDVLRTGSKTMDWGKEQQTPTELARELRGGGDLERYQKAADLMAEIGEGLQDWSTHAKELIPSVVGPRYSMSAVIAGSPTCYRRKIRQEGIGPVKIVLDLTTSACLDTAYLHKRGIILLALAQQVQRFRPVELWAGCATAPAATRRNVAYLFRVGTAPFDVSQACAMIGGGDLARTYLYTCVFNSECGGRSDYLPWPHGLTDAQLYGTGPDDVVIPGARSWEPMVHDPVKYVREKVAALVNPEVSQ